MSCSRFPAGHPFSVTLDSRRRGNDSQKNADYNEFIDMFSLRIPHAQFTMPIFIELHGLFLDKNTTDHLKFLHG